MTNKAFYEDKLSATSISLDLSDRLSNIDNEIHCSVVKRIIRFYNRMVQEQNNIDQVWKPAGEWKNYNDEKSFFYNALLKENTEESSGILKSFWRNQLGLIVKEYAKYEDLKERHTEITNAFLRSILRNYIIWMDVYNLPAERLKLNAEVGNPWGCVIEGVLVTPKATRFHNNAMQINNLLKACNGNIVAEIGAGYGALCHYLLKEIPGVKYIDFDLPETLVLAAYNLLLTFPEKRIFLYGESELNNSTINQFDVLLLPNYAITGFNDKSVDVFFNSFSLSEMTPEANAEYISQISRITKSYFFHNNMDRKGVVNRGFERIPSSEYPVSDDKFLLLSKNYDMFHAHMGDYKEFLYKVL